VLVPQTPAVIGRSGRQVTHCGTIRELLVEKTSGSRRNVASSTQRRLGGNAYEWFAFDITSFSVITTPIVIHFAIEDLFHREKSLPEQMYDS
jgi:hypothetical protein